MPTEVGRIEALYRDPVKSMRGEALDAATLGWRGVEGDRRFALRRVAARCGNPWLSAGRLPDLVSFVPRRRSVDRDSPPTHVLTPEGEELPVFGEALVADVERRHGAAVEMMQLDQGIFDEASLSVITSATVREIGRSSGTEADVRRFRPRVLLRTRRDVAFEEDGWVGGVLTFGDGGEAPAVAVTRRDLRCSMVNLDPDRRGSTPEVMKACMRANDSHAGVYCTVTGTGRLAVGQSAFLHR